MNSQKTNLRVTLVSKSTPYNVYPALSIKYGSPYGNHRTEKENLVVIQSDRLLNIVHDN